MRPGRGRSPSRWCGRREGGKADALNMGINVANYPYFLCIDADSVLQHDSLEKIARPVLEDPTVVAVVAARCGPATGRRSQTARVVRYRMPRKLWPACRCWSTTGPSWPPGSSSTASTATSSSPGPSACFLKSVVIAAGGYDKDTMGEDMELAVKLHVYCRESQRPYRIRYVTDAICWTQVPERLRDLCRQRKRWHIGPFPEHDEAPQHPGQPKYGAGELHLLLLFPLL